MKTIITGSDFSGVGAFDYAINRVAEAKGFKHERVYACDWDKYARITYAHNHGMPNYFPEDVYDRDIPEQSLDIYMTSPPCQAFSFAGNRQGKNDERGILFFNSHEFIKKNKPRFFIFENVKGLLSDDKGRTFGEWVRMLGGKSVNGLPVIFPDDDSVPYHLYWQVMNTKDHGIPQNRERVFLVGIRDDEDNRFQFPRTEHLQLKLKDILELEVAEKYFVKNFDFSKIDRTRKEEDQIREVGNTNPSGTGMNGRIYDEDGISPTLNTNKGKGLKILSYTRDAKGNVTGYNPRDVSNTIHGSTGGGGNTDQFVTNFQGNDIANSVRVGDHGTESHKHNWDYVVIGNKDFNSKDKRLNKAVNENKHKLKEGEPKAIDSYNSSIHDTCPTLKDPCHNDRRLFDGRYVRKLTPRECFRLQDFPDEFDFSVVSDTQAYKQAGNSITVRVLEKILNQLPI